MPDLGGSGLRRRNRRSRGRLGGRGRGGHWFGGLLLGRSHALHVERVERHLLEVLHLGFVFLWSLGGIERFDGVQAERDLPRYSSSRGGWTGCHVLSPCATTRSGGRTSGNSPEVI